MRTIERASAFKRDYKREAKGKYRNILDDELMAVVNLLASDQPLERRHQDHALSGNWSN